MFFKFIEFNKSLEFSVMRSRPGSRKGPSRHFKGHGMILAACCQTVGNTNRDD